MSDLLGKLRKLNPHRVVVYNGDESRVVAVPQRRRRWPAVLEAIESGPWSRVVMQNKAGEDLGYVDGEATEAPDFAVATPASSTEDRALQMAMAVCQLVFTAQRETLNHRDKELTQLLRAQGEVVKDMSAAMRALQGIWQSQVEAASELAAMQTEAALGGQDGITKLIEAAPGVIPLLPHIRALLSGTGKPAAAAQ